MSTLTPIEKRKLEQLFGMSSDAELRGLYGTGHGKHANTEGLSARHAKLAVGAAATLVTFLFETLADLVSRRSKPQAKEAVR